MKICLVLLVAVMGVGLAAPLSSLNNELMDFVTVLPLEKLRAIHYDHLQNDPGYRAGIKYLQSAEFRTVHKALRARQSAKTIVKILKDAGLDLEVWERIAWSYINSIDVSVADDERRTFGSIISEVDDVLPYEQLMDIFGDKLENSPVFKSFYDAVSSETVHRLVLKLLASKEHGKLYKEFVGMDVPVDNIKEAIFVLMGWQTSSPVVNDLPDQ